MVRRGEAADRRREPECSAAGVGDCSDVAVVHVAPQPLAQSRCQRSETCSAGRRGAGRSASNGGPLTTAIGAGEEIVLPAERHATERALSWIVDCCRD
jgi:hypothetical protein